MFEQWTLKMKQIFTETKKEEEERTHKHFCIHFALELLE